MQFSLLGPAALLAAVASATCTNDDNNYYCDQVEAITYEGIGGSGSYNKITSMDATADSCGSTPLGYSGIMSPLDEEVSWHFRGPLTLSQFAAYTPGEASAKKVRRNEHMHHHARGAAAGHAHYAEKVEKRHALGGGHRHPPNLKDVEVRQVGAMVTAAIDGVAVSWINSWGGEPTSDGAPSSAPVTESSEPAAPTDSSFDASASSSGPSTSRLDSSSPGAGWGRQAYYNADAGTASGLVFLNHNGGQGSGTFDYTFGNSLSYASADGTSGASTNQTLAKTTLPSSAEVIIMTDQACTDADCGFTREGTVAYHGFDGSQKAFFFEFQMPNDGSTTSDPYDPVNMPAIWMLNAQIPRTLQYGNEDCSCWPSGCGEFDMFEVLASGDSRAKSTLHGNVAGGDSNYFARPEEAPIKVAMVMFNDRIHIKVLDDGTEFPSTMDSGVIDEIIGSTSSASNSVSLFSLAGASSG